MEQISQTTNYIIIFLYNILNILNKFLILGCNSTGNTCTVVDAIDNFTKIYNNSVIHQINSLGSHSFARIDHLASSVISFLPNNFIPKHYSVNTLYICKYIINK